MKVEMISTEELHSEPMKGKIPAMRLFHYRTSKE
jgi:hypothetical protein